MKLSYSVFISTFFGLIRVATGVSIMMLYAQFAAPHLIFPLDLLSSFGVFFITMNLSITAFYNFEQGVKMIFYKEPLDKEEVEV